MSKVVPVYQYYAKQPYGGIRYFYSIDPNVEAGWTLDKDCNDGVAFKAFKDKQKGTVPVYQYYVEQPYGGIRYFYSTDPHVEAGWTLDKDYNGGIAFYACVEPSLSATPVYQYYFKQEDIGGFRHFYSKDPNIGAGWTLDTNYKEGIAFYAL